MKQLFTALLGLAFTATFAQGQMPNITLSTLDGDTFNVSEVANSDTIKVFSFWATWCVPCINELDTINDVYTDWQDETNVEIIAIATDDARTKKRVSPLVNGKNWDYTIVLDDNQDLMRALNITTVPHVVVVKNGEIIYRHTGYSPGAEDELYEVIQNNVN
ncbi:TlpA family protein disulfide reductase [Mangrovimonas aestuarii]|uniref:TlpA family protein disulfide reductase n=1 Tax=Mangrovimonas aestuarii TaxID=3018443 RepID=UPI0023780640|nr:TlpA disulfide reductase family protein [Mangrovimonas aestuarii]